MVEPGGGGGGGCCRCCTSFIFTLGLTALFMWLSLRTSNPTCSIQSFQVPALNQSQNSSKNTTIYFLLKLDNGNKDKGIHYDNINLTVTHRTNISLPLNTSQPVKQFVVPGFYQGHNKKAKKNQSFVPDGFNWTAATRAVSTNGSTVFRVDLTTKVRFKIIFWNTKRHKLSVGADVVVNKMGVKDQKKGIKLSGGPQLGRFPLWVGVLVNLLAFIFLNSW